jgi:Gas vesicle protein
MATDVVPGGFSRTSGLVDVLDRVLDKGLVIAGDIKISIAEVELLTIRIRLMVCSIDKAQEIGLDWWKHDRHLSLGSDELAVENERLREQIRRLERQLEALPGTAARAPKLRPKRLDRR